MAYRQGQSSNSATTLTACDVPPLIELHMLNGTTSEISIPCRYVVGDNLVPIDLPGEGYAAPFVTIDEPVEGFSAAASVSPDDPSLVRVVLSSRCTDAVERDIDMNLSVLITRVGLDGIQRTDSIIRAHLLIVAGPISVQTGA